MVPVCVIQNRAYLPISLFKYLQREFCSAWLQNICNACKPVHSASAKICSILMVLKGYI